MTELHIALYALLKLAAYATWCGVGARILAGRSALVPGLLLGLLRLGMGLGFGVAIFFGVVLVYGAMQSVPLAGVLTYLAVYVPVRIVEWWLIVVILRRMARGHRAPRAGVVLWIAGGIAVSCLADVPILVLAGGLPVGRFMC